MTKEEMLKAIYEKIGGSRRVLVNHYFNKITQEEKIDYITDENIWMGDVIEYLVRNEHITIEGESGYELRCHTMERRDNGEYPITDQSEECIKFIYLIVSNG